jgi:hypothetical protein
MTLEDLDGYLEAHGLLLDFIYEQDRYHWTVSRSADEVTVGEGVDPNEAAMIAHVLRTPAVGSGVLVSQLAMDVSRESHGSDCLP